MHGFAGIRLCKTMILPILALALASMLAACGSVGASSGSTNNSGATGASANSRGCTFDTADSIGIVNSTIIAGHMRYFFAFANVGSNPCTLKGYPTITLDNSAITVTTTPSADTWSNIAVEPITLAHEDSVWFAIQGRDETTNCAYVTPSIMLPQETKATTSSSTINICGGKLYVSPLVSSPQAFNQ